MRTAALTIMGRYEEAVDAVVEAFWAKGYNKMARSTKLVRQLCVMNQP
jgi:hypothetical protein